MASKKKQALTKAQRNDDIRKAGIVLLRQHEPANRSAEPCADGLIDQGVLVAFAKAADVNPLDPITIATVLERLEQLTREATPPRKGTAEDWKWYAELLEGVLRNIGEAIGVDARGLTSETATSIGQTMVDALNSTQRMPLTRKALRKLLSLPEPEPARVADWTDIVGAVRSLMETATPQADRGEIENLRNERFALRTALIKAGREAGAFLSDDVSTEFLCSVPEEVRGALIKAKAYSPNGMGTNTYDRFRNALGFQDPKRPTVDDLIAKANEAHRDACIRIPAFEERVRKQDTEIAGLKSEHAEKDSIIKGACQSVHKMLQALNIGLHTQDDLDFMCHALVEDGVRHVELAKKAFTSLLNAGPYTPLWQLAEMAEKSESQQALRRKALNYLHALEEVKSRTRGVLSEMLINARKGNFVPTTSLEALIRSLGAEPPTEIVTKRAPDGQRWSEWRSWLQDFLNHHARGARTITAGSAIVDGYASVLTDAGLQAPKPVNPEQQSFFMTLTKGPLLKTNVGGPAGALRDEIEPVLQQGFEMLGKHDAMIDVLARTLLEVCHRTSGVGASARRLEDTMRNAGLLR